MSHRGGLGRPCSARWGAAACRRWGIRGWVGAVLSWVLLLGLAPGGEGAVAARGRTTPAWKPTIKPVDVRMRPWVSTLVSDVAAAPSSRSYRLLEVALKSGSDGDWVALSRHVREWDGPVSQSPALERAVELGRSLEQVLAVEAAAPLEWNGRLRALLQVDSAGSTRVADRLRAVRSVVRQWNVLQSGKVPRGSDPARDVVREVAGGVSPRVAVRLGEAAAAAAFLGGRPGEARRLLEAVEAVEAANADPARGTPGSSASAAWLLRDVLTAIEGGGTVSSEVVGGFLREPGTGGEGVRGPPVRGLLVPEVTEASYRAPVLEAPSAGLEPLAGMVSLELAGLQEALFREAGAERERVDAAKTAMAVEMRETGLSGGPMAATGITSGSTNGVFEAEWRAWWGQRDYPPDDLLLLHALKSSGVRPAAAARLVEILRVP